MDEKRLWSFVLFLPKTVLFSVRPHTCFGQTTHSFRSDHTLFRSNHTRDVSRELGCVGSGPVFEVTNPAKMTLCRQTQLLKADQCFGHIAGDADVRVVL